MNYRLEIAPDRETSVKAETVQGEVQGLAVLAHGLANNLDLPLLVQTARALADKGVIAVRFNFLYREKGLDRPDSEKMLLTCLTRVAEDALARFGVGESCLILGGKSLGARISALAAGSGFPTIGLFHLGFPLHPPGRPELSREELLKKVGPKPQIFFTGTRDPLCPVDSLKSVIKNLPGPTALHVIEEGDHSFRLPAERRGEEEQVRNHIAAQTAGWVGQVLSGTAPEERII